MIEKLGKYKVIEKLGEGATGAVYRAYDAASDSYFAVKVMISDLDWDPELKQRFHREAAAAAGLQHPNIVTIHEIGEEGRITFIVMELLAGQDLKTVVRDRTPYTLGQKLSYIVQVSDGLDYAHASGVIHRDIKPSNIHIGTAGQVKILDFGIARIPSSGLARSGVRRGTPIYMAPEQIRGEQCGRKSDIFSAGIVFYELLTYIHPFRDKNIVKTMDNILSQVRLPFAEHLPEAPSSLWPILEKCLAKDPGDRYGSMAEVSRACLQLLQEMNQGTGNMEEGSGAVAPSRRPASKAAQTSGTVVPGDEETNAPLDHPGKIEHLSVQGQAWDLAGERGRQSETPSSERETEETVPPTPASGRPAPETANYPPVRFSSEAQDFHVTPVPSLVHREQADAVAGSVPSRTQQSAAPQAKPPGSGLDENHGHELVKTGKALLEQSRLEEAADSFRQAMGLLGPTDELVGLMGETRRRIDERRRSRSAELLGEARGAIASGDFRAVVRVLDEVLQLRPGDPDASEMRRQARVELEKEKKRHARETEGEREKVLGFKLLAERKFRDSLRALRRAADLRGLDAAIELGIDEAQDGLREEELQARVRTGLSEAASSFQARSLEKAKAQAIGVLELCPKNTEALQLLDRIEMEEEQRQLDLDAETLCRRSLEALGRNEFEEAAILVAEALGIKPGNAQARDLLDRIEREKGELKKRQEVSALLAKAQQALAQQDFDGAAASSEDALKIIPQDAQAKALIAQIHTAVEERQKHKEIATAVAQARQALLRGDLDQSEEHARQAIAIDPQHAATLEVLARIEDERLKIRKDQVAARIEEGRRALGGGDVKAARRHAQEALGEDPHSAEAAALIQAAVQAEERLRRVDIDGLISRSRAALEKRDFDNSAELATRAMELDGSSKEVKSLVKAIEKARRSARKEMKKQKTKAPAQETPRPVMTAAGGKIAIKPAKPDDLRQGRKMMLWIGAAVIALIVVAAPVLYLSGFLSPQPPDLTTQIADAKSSLDQKLYDKAIQLSQLVLTASPANAEAEAILKAAQLQKKRETVDNLVREADTFRAQNRLNEADSTLQRILEIDPVYSPAWAVRLQIEAEISSAKSREEQDRAVKEGLDNALRLMDAGMTDAAKAEIDKVALLRPDAPELEALRNRLREKMSANGWAQPDQPEGQTQPRIAELRQKSSDLFSQGKYAEAITAMNEWLAVDPQNSQAHSLRNQLDEAQTSARNYETAISAKRYDDALNAIAHLQQINPADRNIEAYKKAVEDAKASARATISILRLGEPGALALNEQPIGVNGEIENHLVPIGRHKLSVKNAQGRQSILNVDLTEGQKAEFVYDALPALRAFAPATDRALLEKRKSREEIHTFQVEHSHGTFRGKCRGLLTISGISVAYKTAETDHSFAYRFEELKLAVNNDRLEFSAPDKKITLTLPTAANATAVKQLWDKLLQLGKQ